MSIKKLIVFLGVAMLLACLAAGLYVFWQDIFRPAGGEGVDPPVVTTPSKVITLVSDLNNRLPKTFDGSARDVKSLLETINKQPQELQEQYFKLLAKNGVTKEDLIRASEETPVYLLLVAGNLSVPEIGVNNLVKGPGWEVETENLFAVTAKEGYYTSYTEDGKIKIAKTSFNETKLVIAIMGKGKEPVPVAIVGCDNLLLLEGLEIVSTTPPVKEEIPPKKKEEVPPKKKEEDPPKKEDPPKEEKTSYVVITAEVTFLSSSGGDIWTSAKIPVKLLREGAVIETKELKQKELLKFDATINGQYGIEVPKYVGNFYFVSKTHDYQVVETETEVVTKWHFKVVYRYQYSGSTGDDSDYTPPVTTGDQKSSRIEDYGGQHDTSGQNKAPTTELTAEPKEHESSGQFLETKESATDLSAPNTVKPKTGTESTVITEDKTSNTADDTVPVTDANASVQDGAEKPVEGRVDDND